MTYKEFIESILKTRGRFNCEGYKERHHIIPKCMGGTNNDDNLIDLYAQEHFIAHKMLAMEHSDNHKIVYAFYAMSCGRSKNKPNTEVSPEDYAKARELYAQVRPSITGSANPMYGRYKDKNPCYGRKHTEEECKKMRNNHVDMSGKNNPMYGLRGDKSPHAKPVYCPELNMTFGSITSAAEFIGRDESGIGACLRGVQLTSGVHPETGERLHWNFMEVIA